MKLRRKQNCQKRTFCKLPGNSCVLSMILMATCGKPTRFHHQTIYSPFRKRQKTTGLTSFPVGTCLASLTLAKLPLPIVLSSLYLPMCGSSDERLRDDPREIIPAEAPPPPPALLLPPPPPPPVELLLLVAASLPCENKTKYV